jgi:hypothetical protein
VYCNFTQVNSGWSFLCRCHSAGNHTIFPLTNFFIQRYKIQHTLPLVGLTNRPLLCLCLPACVAPCVRLCLLHCVLPGSGFSSWSGLSSLTHLSLTGCSGLTDTGLVAVAGSLGGQLQELHLPGCRAVSDEGVAALAVMTGLRTLNLSSNRALSGRWVWCCGQWGAS